MLGDWSSLETPLPWRQKRDGVDGSGMTKGQGERSAVVECSVAAGVRRLCGHAFPPLGTSTAVPIPPPRTCREVENRLPVPAAYSARRNESQQSSSSLLINRRRGGGIIVWHLAYPARACAGRANPRGASSSPGTQRQPRLHLTAPSPPSPGFRFRQGPRVGCDTAAPTSPQGHSWDSLSGLLSVLRPAFPGAASG